MRPLSFAAPWPALSQAHGDRLVPRPHDHLRRGPSAVVDVRELRSGVVRRRVDLLRVAALFDAEPARAGEHDLGVAIPAVLGDPKKLHVRAAERLERARRELEHEHA